MGCCWRRLSDLVLGHLHLGGQLRERGRPPVLQLEAGAGLAVIGERAGGGLLEILAGRRPDLNLLREPDLVVLGQQRVLAEPGPPQTHQRSQARCATSPNLTCSTNLDSGASLVADALANVQHRGAPPHPGGSPR